MLLGVKLCFQSSVSTQGEKSICIGQDSQQEKFTGLANGCRPQ